MTPIKVGTDRNPTEGQLEFKCSSRVLVEPCPARRLDARWLAIYTLPQNEFKVANFLSTHAIEFFLPTVQVVHKWNNRRRVTLSKPIFPTYVFAHLRADQHLPPLHVSGAVRIVGNRNGPAVILDQEMEFLRTQCSRDRLEPYPEFPIGERVRIKHGAMQGIEGTLVRRTNGPRFVLTVQAIQQSVAIEVAAEDLEPIRDRL